MSALFWISDFHLVYSRFYITSPCPILLLSLLLMVKMLVPPPSGMCLPSLTSLEQSRCEKHSVFPGKVRATAVVEGLRWGKWERTEPWLSQRE